MIFTSYVFVFVLCSVPDLHKSHTPRLSLLFSCCLQFPPLEKYDESKLAGLVREDLFSYFIREQSLSATVFLGPATTFLHKVWFLLLISQAKNRHFHASRNIFPLSRREVSQEAGPPKRWTDINQPAKSESDWSLAFLLSVHVICICKILSSTVESLLP